MPAYKDSKTGTWFVKFYCKDWTGENKQIKKRGFATKREALDYERNYKIRQENNLDMTFGEFWKLYTEDVKNYIKLNTWLTKEHIVETKILPYFKNLKMNEITPGDVRKWQNEMVAFRYENGKSYSQTYKKTMHNILSAIFNHACRFYNLKSNPARQAGNMGREEKKEMLFWTTEEYKKFSEAVIDKPVSFYAFEMLYWTGMRLGELVIEVPRADFTVRPVYKGENPFKGTYKRNHEGDYHAKEYGVRAMIRDQSAEGNDSTILEGYSMDDIDADTLERYRIMFNSWNPQHVWRELPDKEFLEMLGGYRRDRREKVEGLTVAGLLMFGSGLAIRDEFDNIFMDYRNETDADDETRWVDRITYDGTWENNLFNFFRKVTPKLTEDLKKPFVLKDMQRIEDTPVHKAIREAFVNMIIHADYRMDAGVLKIVKFNDGFRFSNPGSLKLPKEQIYKGGESKARNPHMQTMLRMVGFGDNAGSGFPDILKIWSDNGWEIPELMEDTILNQVTLILKYKTDEVGESIFLDAKMSEDEKNERRLSEDLSEVMTSSDYKKVEAIILYLEDNKYVTPQIAEKLTGKSAPTVRRYLKDL